MTGESANSQKMLLAVALAEGTSVAKWASSNEVPERTAYRWAAEPEVRSEVETIRRRALDEAIGRMAKRATWAVDGIVDLGENAASESVRLAALRAVMSDFIKVSKSAGIELRVAALEEQSSARTHNKN
jgi:L-amino acid N-acyltransferase YncA